MSIKVRRNFPSLTRLALTNKTLMRQVGNLVLRLVTTRTRAGKDMNGQSFAPLSPEYAAQKRKALGSARADLTVSGRMLNDMAIQAVGAKDVSVGYKGAGGGRASGGTFIQRSRSVSGAAKAFYHNESGAGKKRVKREYMGLTKAEEDQVADAVIAHLDKVLKGKK